MQSTDFGYVAHPLGHAGGEARVLRRIRHRHGLAGGRRPAGDTGAERHAERLDVLGARADGDPEHHLVGLVVDQVERRAARIHDAGRRADDHLEQLVVHGRGDPRAGLIVPHERLAQLVGELRIG